MRFTAGQVPVRPLVVTLVTGASTPVDLSVYDRFEVVLRSPSGVPISTAGSVAAPVDGKVRYAWPTTTLFPSPGDYSLTIKAYSGAAFDETERVIIEVYREGSP